MKCKVKNELSQGRVRKDFTSAEVCTYLNVGKRWLMNHRNAFDWYELPGRGRYGKAIRFTRESVEEYRRARIRAVKDTKNPFAGKSVKEISQIVRERARREAMGTNS